jgi:hypothetical protein
MYYLTNKFVRDQRIYVFVLQNENSRHYKSTCTTAVVIEGEAKQTQR